MTIYKKNVIKRKSIMAVSTWAVAPGINGTCQEECIAEHIPSAQQASLVKLCWVPGVHEASGQTGCLLQCIRETISVLVLDMVVPLGWSQMQTSYNVHSRQWEQGVCNPILAGPRHG